MIRGMYFFATLGINFLSITNIMLRQQTEISYQAHRYNIEVSLHVRPFIGAFCIFLFAESPPHPTISCDSFCST